MLPPPRISPPLRFLIGCCAVVVVTIHGRELYSAERPHIVLVMADDQGWGQTGYYNHSMLKTPNLDLMAAGGLRFDRFYAGAPVCSPTRASVLTGRTNDRTGVESHGYALRRQEITIASILRDHGYETGHFGKWHLNGLRGPGVPILDSDSHKPGAFGFAHWLSVTNFFDRDPMLSRQGVFEEYSGDSSEIVVEQALGFIRQRSPRSPTFTVIWYGTPHDPFKALEADMKGYTGSDEPSRQQHGELVAMDRSLGALRSGLREIGIADNTLVWFCSDNGGLGKIKPDAVGGLRGSKSTVYEGGLRVPAVIEWPAGIETPRVTDYPACVTDMLPTILDIVGVEHPDRDRPLDGISLKELLDRDLGRRKKPIGFRWQGRGAWIDGDMKLVSNKIDGGRWELYDLKADTDESEDLSKKRRDVAERMRRQFLDWNASVSASFDGEDYPEGEVNAGEPEPRFWMGAPEYAPHLDQFRTRWEYKTRIEKFEKR